MALTAKSLFLYGFSIDINKASIDFKISSGGAEKRATLRYGYYSLTALMSEVKRSMESADTLNKYTVTADRTFSGGTQVRVTIATNGSYLSLLFGTGTRNASTVGPTLGYTATDKTGALLYQSQASAGTVLIPEYPAYTYLGPDFIRTVFGTVNVSTNGDKEAIVWNVQQFFEANFKYEPESKVVIEWQPFLTWAISQKYFEFTPMITAPSTYYECTLESTTADGKGLGYRMTELLPDFPFNYTTGLMKFRKKNA
jgi:hypothetical protein